MHGWQFSEVNKPLTFVELPDPAPAAGEIVLDTRVAGFCHTDVGYQNGTLTHVLGHTPIILGHEIAGVVSAVGEDVTNISVGDHVAIRGGVETPGTRTNGGFATKVLSPAEFAVKIPEGVSFESAAIATDAGMTSYHAVAVVGQVKAGMKVGIVGLGGLGYFGAQIAAGLGAKVYAADPNEAARATAKEFGFEKYVSEVKEFAGEDLDVIVDFAGFGTTTAGAIDVVKPGGRVVQIGLGLPEATINIPTLVINQVHLIGSLGGTVEDVEAVLKLIAEGKIKPLVTTIPFDQVPEGLKRLERGEVRGRLVTHVGG